MTGVVCRAFIEKDSRDTEVESLHAEMLHWFTKLEVFDEMEEWEASFLKAKLGEADEQHAIQGTWLSEGLAVIAWALRRYDLPSFNVYVDPKKIAQTLLFLQPDAHTSLIAFGLREFEEIANLQDELLTVHWRLTEFSLTNQKMEFAKFAETSWFGPINIKNLVLIDGDLAINGVPINEVPFEILQTCQSIVLERHRAINWLTGYGSIYSQVPTDT